MVNIEKVKTEHGRKTIIKMPIRYAYYQPEHKIDSEDEDYDFDYYRKDELPPVLIDLQTATCEVVDDLKTRIMKQPLCDIHFNTRDNPVPTNFYNRMRTFKAIQYISVLEYSNRKNAVFTFLESEVCFVQSKNRVFNRNPVSYQLTVRNDGKTTLTKNGKALLTNVAIEGFFSMVKRMIVRKYIDKHRGYAQLKRLFIKYFLQNNLPVDGVWGVRGIEDISYKDLTKIYRVKQNPKLEDLPWSIYEIAHVYDYTLAIPAYSNSQSAKRGERSVSNVKVSLNRYLRRGDTKKAVEACFYGYKYPKSINKVLFQTKPLEFPYATYKSISELVERIGVNDARNFITNKDGSPNYTSIHNHYVVELLDLGFTLNAIKKSSVREAADTLKLRRELLDQNYTLEFDPNIKRYHDYLMEKWTAERQAIRAASNEAYRKAELRRSLVRKKLEAAYINVDTTNEGFYSEVGDFIFRTPARTNELRDVANNLNICVNYDYYLQSFYLGHLDIVVITKQLTSGEEKYIGCLEVKGKHIVQAKLNSNIQVVSNPSVMTATKKWAKEKGVKLACEDVGARYKVMSDNATNKERLDICGVTIEDIRSLGY